MPQDQPSSKAYKACLGCRRRRTRCDRKQPCQRCQQHSVECIHDNTRRQSKPELRQEKANLEDHLHNASLIFQSLAQGIQTNNIIQLLRSGASLEAIAKRIRGTQEVNSKRKLPIDEPTLQARKSQKPPQPIDNAGDSNLAHGFPATLSFVTAIDEGILSISGAQDTTATRPPQVSLQGVQDTLSSPGLINDVWVNSGQIHSINAMRPADGTSDGSSPMDQALFSNIPSPPSYSSSPNSVFEQHQGSIYNPPCNVPIDLMSLPCKLVLDFTSAFFTWKDLPFPVIRRSLFLSDFLAGRSDHCSPALIRSISCLGCRALGGHNTKQSTYATLGNRLFNEAWFLLVLTPDPVPSIGDVQALGLLALHQLGVGRNADAIQLADEGARRMAIMADEKVKIEAGGFDASSASMRAEALLSAVSLARFVRLITSYVASQEQILTISSQFPANCFGQDDGPPDVEKSLNLDNLISSQPPKEDISEVAILTCRLIDWIYRISTGSVLTEKVLSNNLLENYQIYLAWYEQALNSRKSAYSSTWFITFAYSSSSGRTWTCCQHLGCLLQWFFQESREAILSLAASSNNLGGLRAKPLPEASFHTSSETNYCNIPLGLNPNSESKL